MCDLVNHTLNIIVLAAIKNSTSSPVIHVEEEFCFVGVYQKSGISNRPCA